jgi:hypothetical protein
MFTTCSLPQRHLRRFMSPECRPFIWTHCCGADQARDGHAARQRAICLAARLAALCLRGEQQHRSGKRPGRDRPLRQRVSHRSREWRSDASWSSDPSTDATDPHQSLGSKFSWGNLHRFRVFRSAHETARHSRITGRFAGTPSDFRRQAVERQNSRHSMNRDREAPSASCAV